MEKLHVGLLVALVLIIIIGIYYIGGNKSKNNKSENNEKYLSRPTGVIMSSGGISGNTKPTDRQKDYAHGQSPKNCSIIFDENIKLGNKQCEYYAHGRDGTPGNVINDGNKSSEECARRARAWDMWCAPTAGTITASWNDGQHKDVFFRGAGLTREQQISNFNESDSGCFADMGLQTCANDTRYQGLARDEHAVHNNRDACLARGLAYKDFCRLNKEPVMLYKGEERYPANITFSQSYPGAPGNYTPDPEITCPNNLRQFEGQNVWCNQNGGVFKIENCKARWYSPLAWQYVGSPWHSIKWYINCRDHMSYFQIPGPNPMPESSEHSFDHHGGGVGSRF